MKKLVVKVTQTLFVKDDLKIEKINGIENILWKNRHYHPDILWFKALKKEESNNSNFTYGDEATSVEADEFDEDILIEYENRAKGIDDLHDYSFSIKNVE